MVECDPETPKETPTDLALRVRTERLLRAAEAVSLELQQQTERLAMAIDLFDAEVIAPLRRGIENI